MSSKLVLFKLVVLGSGGVGKTALTIQFCLNHFVETYDPTIEDSYRKQVVIDNQQCMLEILDTAGQEEYTALRDQWIRDGEGFLLVYSVTSRNSFNQIPRFFKQINRVKEVVGHRATTTRVPNGPQYSGPSPIMLVGNKCDRVTEREVSTQEGAQMAKELGCNFIEASAKNNMYVDRAFFDLARKLRRQRIDPEQAKRRDNPAENEKFAAKAKGGIKARYRRREAAKKMCVIL